MPQATILHLSDLHFGAKGQRQVWDSLRDYINGRLDPRPDLVVVTGDIVDTPSPDSLKLAREQIGLLAAGHKRRFLVCPGNHDRHWRGNATAWLTRWVPRLKRAGDAAALFAATFDGHLTRLDQHEDIRLKAGHYDWCVRFGGLDSALNAKYLARGCVTLGDLEHLHDLAREVKDVDAVFLLMHHHLLPVAAVERTAQAASGLLAATTVVNAGMTLGAITASQVNVVLHGHEHQRNIARYGNLGSGQGDSVVLGCGSSTGVVTLGECDPRPASSNLIELRDDQSIWVKELRYDNGWSVRDETAVCLVPTVDLRRAKFLRVAGAERLPPSSEVVKHVRFTPQRDAVVRESRTDWLIKGKEFAVLTRNRSGAPVNPRVDLRLPAGAGARSLSPGGFEVTHEPGCYVYKLALDGPGPTLAKEIDIAFEWIDGGMLTRQDLELIPSPQRGPFREDGYEFVAISVTNDLRAFQLHAHIAAGFWPAHAQDAVKVFVQDISRNAGPVELPYLKEHLLTSGPGVLSLSVPYPMTHHRYIMAWRLPDAQPDSAATRMLREKLGRHGAAALGAFAAAIAHMPWASLVSLALYLPEIGNDGVPVVSRAAHYAGPGAAPQMPQEAVSLRGAQWAFRHAWWDGEGISYAQEGVQSDADAIEAGMLPQERWLFVVPLRELSHRPGAAPAAMIRIGIAEAIRNFRLHEAESAFEFSQTWTGGLISVLYHLEHCS
jgi:hypothetical protein